VDVNQQKFDLFHLSRTEILNKENKYQIIARIENITRPLHSQPQLNEKMYFVEIFSCLFCNFRGRKSTRTRTQNREKERSGLSIANKNVECMYCRSRNIRHGLNFVGRIDP
jgi:hypothetical protein